MMKNKRSATRLNSLFLSLLILTSVVVSDTVFGDIVPNPVMGSEGEIIDLTVTLPTTFFQVADADAKARCLDGGYEFDAGWYLLFGFRGYDESATWGDDSTADLQFYNNYNGDDYGSVSDGWMWCLPSGTLPETVTDTQISIRLHDDFVTEGTETARFEYYSRFDNQAMASADVTITDVPDPQVSDLVVDYVSEVDYTRNGSAFIYADWYNNGSVTSSDYQVSFRRSWDSYIDIYDEEFAAVSMPALEPGYWDFIDQLIAFPSDPGQTTPYWGYCIIDASDEAATSNNCSNANLYPLVDAAAATATCAVSTLSCGFAVGGNLNTNDCESGPRWTPVGESFSGTPGVLAEAIEFEGTAGQTVDVFADWLGTVDGFLYLEDPHGYIEEFNDDYNSDTGYSKIADHILAYTGTYRIWSTTYSYHDVGDFQVSLTCGTPPSGGTITIDPTSYEVSEDIGNVNVQVNRTGGTNGAVSVSYSTTSGTATDPGDYTGMSATLSWADGDSSTKVISIPVINDTDSEVNEQFTLDIFNPSGEYSPNLGNTTATVTILDDDPEVPVMVYINQFYASPSSIMEGAEISLLWSTEGADQCYGEDGVAEWLGEKALNGSHSLVVEAAGQNVFRLTCLNESGGQATRTTTVNVEGSNPDLMLESLTLNHSEVSAGASVTANADFSNQGDGTSPSSPVTWYLSTNEAISDTDSILDTDELAALSAGHSGAESSTFTVPSVAGAYWVGVCVDPVDGEPDTINNCSGGVPLSVLSSAVCDITAIECGANSSGSLNEANCQAGPMGAGHYAAARTFAGTKGQSVILQAGWGNGDGYLALESPAGEIIIANDDFGDSQHSRIEHTLQSSGTFKTWLTTFESGTEPTFNLALTCPEPAEPNLEVTLTQGPPDELIVGELFDVQCGIENIGDGQASETTIRYMLSTNPQVSTSDHELGAFELSSMAPDSGTLEEWETELPAPGDYWFGACVDAVDGESLQGNNCTEGQRVSVRADADCSSEQIESGVEISSDLSSLDCDLSPRGAAYSSKSYTFNRGKNSLISVDAQWNGFDGYLYIQDPDGEVFASNDDQFDRESSWIDAELPKGGEYTIWATSYSPGISGSFNLTMSDIAACESRLTADSITTDKVLLEDGEQVTVSAQISAGLGCAQQTVSSQSESENHLSKNPKVSADETPENSQLRYFLSTNNKITSGDAEVGKDVIDAIQGGSNSTEYLLVEAPVTSGKYWIGACLDVIDDDCVVSEPIEVQSNVESIPFNSGINDAWWDSSQPGQGILISVFPSSKFIFMAWFTYDTELPPEDVSANIGDPGHRWMTAYGFYDGNSATLDIELTSGGIFNSNDPQPTQETDGTVQIQFTDCNVGRVIYDIPSINQQGTVEIARVTRENLHLCEAAMSDTQQLQSSIHIEAEPALVKTGAGTVLSWQAPAGMRCVSEGGSGRWAEGMELESSGSRKVRVSAEGKYNFGMVCTDGFPETGNVATSTPVTAVNVDDNDTEKSGQKVLFNPGLNDAWFDPNTPGQGVLLTVFPDSEYIFLAWFTFDTERPSGEVPYKLGDPGHRWMTAYGFYDGSTANLTLELTKGGIFDSTEPAPTQEDYGTLDLSFEHCNSGQMTYNIPSAGLTGTIPLERGALDKVAECQAQDGIDDPIDGLQRPEPKKQMPNKCGSAFTWDFEWEAQKGYQSYQIQIRNGRSDNPVTQQYVYRASNLSLTKSEAITDGYLSGWRWRIRGFSDDTPLIQYGPWSEEWEFDVAAVSACN